MPRPNRAVPIVSIGVAVTVAVVLGVVAAFAFWKGHGQTGFSVGVWASVVVASLQLLVGYLIVDALLRRHQRQMAAEEERHRRAQWAPLNRHVVRGIALDSARVFDALHRALLTPLNREQLERWSQGLEGHLKEIVPFIQEEILGSGLAHSTGRYIEAKGQILSSLRRLVNCPNDSNALAAVKVAVAKCCGALDDLEQAYVREGWPQVGEGDRDDDPASPAFWFRASRDFSRPPLRDDLNHVRVCHHRNGEGTAIEIP